jgi:hypothetical protein
MYAYMLLAIKYACDCNWAACSEVAHLLAPPSQPFPLSHPHSWLIVCLPSFGSISYAAHTQILHRDIPLQTS